VILLFVGLLIRSGVIGGESGTSNNIDSGVLEATNQPAQPTLGTSGTAPAATRPGTAQVVDVIDGETIEVRIGSEAFTVRYIGVAGLETVDPGATVDCFGAEAAAMNEKLVKGKQVELERDVTDGDSRGRLLRYVYLDEEMVNAVLVREGYVLAYPIPPDVAHAKELAGLEAEARDAGRGLWSACPESAELNP
jgi:micrococcal nuclease